MTAVNLMGEEVVPAKPTPDIVRELCDRFGFDPNKVRNWSYTRAFATLEARKKEEAIALQRAEAKAAAIDGQRGRVPPVLRLHAADYLEEAIAAGGPDNLCLAVSYACCHLQDDEVRRLAEFMAKKFRSEP